MKSSTTLTKTKQSPLVVLPQPPISVRRDPSRESTMTHWDHILIWFMRLVAVCWMFKGILVWCGLLGISFVRPIDFANLSFADAAIVLFFSIFNFIAAVGLWLAAPWGGVLWLVAVLAEMTAQIIFYHSFLDLWFQNLISTSLVGGYFYLSWLAARALDEKAL
jgi:Family of unknown function (DUF6163)